jgi:hypothetical protein
MNIQSIAFLVFFIAGPFSFYYYDRIVKLECFNYHEQWLADGSPPGFFWWPKKAKVLSGSIRRSNLMLQFLFSTPEWALADRIALRYLLKLRMSSGLGVLAWLISISAFISWK